MTTLYFRLVSKEVNKEVTFIIYEAFEVNMNKMSPVMKFC